MFIQVFKLTGTLNVEVWSFDILEDNNYRLDIVVITDSLLSKREVFYEISFKNDS